MTKRILISGMAAGLAFPLVWLAAGFIAYDLNPEGWDFFGRFLTLCAATFLGGIFFIFSMAMTEKG